MKDVGTVPVKPFGRDDAAALLFKFIQAEPADEKEREMARELSDTVDGLPLAIATMRGYIDQSGDNLGAFLRRLKTSSNAWTDSAVTPDNQYEKYLDTVFNIAITTLPYKARIMTGILAFLNPDHIPVEIFTTAIGKRPLGFLHNEGNLLKLIRELERRQLVRWDVSGAEPYLATQRTVQWNVLIRLSSDPLFHWDVFEQAFRLVRDVLPTESPFIIPSSDTWPRYQKYGAHILTLRAHCLWPDPPVDLPVEFAQVLADMSTYMWHAGKFLEGQDALKTAVTIMDKNELEDHHPLRANAYKMLGIMSSFEGVSERRYSMDLRYKALEARKLSYNSIPPTKVTRDDEIKRWTVESDVAYGLVQQEDFEPAAEIMERCLNKYQEWGSEDEYPYQYSQYYQIIAVCQMAAGKPAESIDSITHCVDLLIKASDIMHPMAQLMQFITGYLTWHAGEPQKALEILSSVLEARRKIIGDFNHCTLESYSTCARLLADKGDYEKAR